MPLLCTMLGFALCAILPLTEAGAQPLISRPTIGLGGGFARGPHGDIGFHGVVRLESATRARVLRLRAEGLHAQWGGVGITRVESATLSAMVLPLPQARVAPYLLAGGGAYDIGDVVKGGWTAGVGLRLRGSWPVAIESRVHSFTSGVDFRAPGLQFAAGRRTVYMPLSVSVQF